jgi:hypothetical protein
MFQEYTDFKLSIGFEKNGKKVSSGRMRLATAGDEFDALGLPAVKKRSDYISFALLAAVCEFDEVGKLSPEEIKSLFAVDFNILQNLYTGINSPEPLAMSVVCPHCGEEFDEPVNFTMAE